MLRHRALEQQIFIVLYIDPGEKSTQAVYTVFKEYVVTEGTIVHRSDM
jgi:hypothetical protein